MIVGVLGGGQLGRMLALAGYPLGLRFRFFDPSPAACAGQLAELVVAAYEDEAALERFVQHVDVVTYEFENVPVAAARRLADIVPVRPGPRALEVAQDRLVEKRFFERLGIATAPFEPVDSRDDLERAIERIGLPAVLKTRREGYDGKGQVVIRDRPALAQAWGELSGRPLVLEGFVPFDRELSILATRGLDGALAAYPLVANTHRDGILRESIAPAPDLSADVQRQAETIAAHVLDNLDYVGVVAVELFQVGDVLLANELAPRVHNSGHWTIEGAATSQFENHLRAVLGLPLGETSARGVAGMLNIIGSPPLLTGLLTFPGARVHLYGKAPRPGRKVGHVTLVDTDSSRFHGRFAALRQIVAR